MNNSNKPNKIVEYRLDLVKIESMSRDKKLDFFIFLFLRMVFAVTPDFFLQLPFEYKDLFQPINQEQMEKEKRKVQ
jgi:hypothetical protein